MKQLLVHGGAVFIESVPAPVVGPRNILVALRHSCVSIGTEMAGVRMSALPLYRRALKQPQHVKKVVQLMRDQGIKRTYDIIKGRLDAGLPIGYSAAGEVVAVGEAVESFRPGDRVACAGAGIANHAEYVDVPVNLAVAIPDGLETELASTVTLGAIAMHGVRRAAPTLGETVLVIGLGILGQITAQLLSKNGCRVIGSDVDQRRIAIARENGMEHGVDPAAHDLPETVAKLTDGYGADAVIITAATASHDVIGNAFNACRRKARVVVVGDVGLHIERSDMYRKELDLLMSTSYGPGRYDPIYEEDGQDYPLPYVRWTENRNMAEYLRLLASGRISLANMRSEPYDIDRAEQAYLALKGDGEKPLLVVLAFPTQAGPPSPTVRVASLKKMDRRIGVAVVGAGMFAQAMHLPNLARMPEFELRAIVNRTGATARGVADRFKVAKASTDYDAVLADPDIDLVLIATRHNLHGSMVLAALSAGKNVFVEKPLALKSEELEAIRAFYCDKPDGPLLMTGFNRRFAPAVAAARRILAQRTSPVMINYRMNAGYIAADHWVHGEEGGGRNLGEACHIYDLFNALIGSAPASIEATSVVPTSRYWRRDDNFVATVAYRDGSVCSLTYTALGNKKHLKERAEIYLDGVVLELDDYKALRVIGGKAKGWSSMSVQKGQLEELKALAIGLRSGTWPIPLEEQIMATEISLEVERQIWA